MRAPSGLMGALGSLALSFGLAAGCAAPVETEPASTASPVVGGVAAPYEHPEIGRLSACTGTLVAPDVVLSAAHCFDFEGGARSVGDFVIDRPSGALARRAVEVLVFGVETGRDDLALVRLADGVPGDVARPAEIASAPPARGEPATLWGYGCTSRPEPLIPTGGGVIVSGGATDKRKAPIAWDEASMSACPGDSGGPVLDARGRIVGVASAYINVPVDEGGGQDVFADPVGRAAELRAEIARLSSSPAP